MSKEFVLLLDTRDREVAYLGLAKGGTLVRSRSIGILGATHRIFSAVRSMTNPGRLSGIVVARGPGSFTAVRMGIVVANALAFALDIPLSGIRVPVTLPPSRASLTSLASVRPQSRGLTLPIYDAPPSITKKRKR